MNALAALTPTPVRAAAAPPDDTARDGNAGDFAAALDVACEPAPANAKTLPSRGDGTTSRAKTSTSQAAQTDQALADDEPDADLRGSDLTLALPLPLPPLGWPALVEAAPINEPSASTAASTDNVPGDVATLVALAGATARAARAKPDAAVAATVQATSTALAARGQARAIASLAPAAMPVTPNAAMAAPVTPSIATATQAPPGVAATPLDRPRAVPSQATAAASAEAVEPIRAKMVGDPTVTAALASSAPPLLGAAQSLQPAVGPPVEAHVAAALDSPAFAPALANHVTWLIHEGHQHARLTLNPAELGPLTVKIMVDGNHARVDFSADMAVTRSAIEASLPVLAAALHESGLTLAGGGVFDGQPRPGAQQDQAARRPATPGTPSALPREAAPVLPQRAARGLVDLIA